MQSGLYNNCVAVQSMVSYQLRKESDYESYLLLQREGLLPPVSFGSRLTEGMAEVDTPWFEAHTSNYTKSEGFMLFCYRYLLNFQSA